MQIQTQILVVALCCLAQSAFGQVFKCAVNGETHYQQSPCESKGMTGAKLKLPQTAPNAAAAPALPVQQQQADAPSPQVPAGVPVPPPPLGAVKSQLEKESDICLEWYRPMLRDPNGAYYKSPTKDGRVLTIVVYATNGFGGYVNKAASCEFKDGRHDVDWTKIHAQRLGW